MNLLPSGGGGGASLCSSDRCALKFTHPIPPLFSNRRPGRCNCNPTQRPQTQPKLPTLAAANPGASRPSAATVTPPSSTIGSHFNAAGDDVISLITQDRVPPEGVIQFQNPNSSSRIGKWSKVALLAGGDVVALLLFSAIGRFTQGLPVLHSETLRTADPFSAGWFFSAYFLGGYAEDGLGMNGLFKGFIAATKTWSLGIPLGLIIRATTDGHIPSANIITATMRSTAVLLIGWRTLLLSSLPDGRG
nr:uncharacterized protein LOC109170220 [Ipomoea batatas]